MEWLAYIALGAFAGFGAFLAGYLVGLASGQPTRGKVIDLTGMRQRRR